MPRWPSSLLPGEKENEEIRASWLSMVRGDRTPTGEAAARGGAVGASMCVELAQLRPGHVQFYPPFRNCVLRLINGFDQHGTHGTTHTAPQQLLLDVLDVLPRLSRVGG